jgi:hypothetical protein
LDFERLPKGFRRVEKATVKDYVRRSKELVGVFAGLFEEEDG